MTDYDAIYILEEYIRDYNLVNGSFTLGSHLALESGDRQRRLMHALKYFVDTLEEVQDDTNPN